MAIGRGTQNYTCDVANATAVPVQAGAVATLFNASCMASAYPDVLHMLPRLALQFDLDLAAATTTTTTTTTSSDGRRRRRSPEGQGLDGQQLRLGPTNLAVSGHHFFTNVTTPFFALDGELGRAPCSKADSQAAPADAPRGRQGEAAVPWLQLRTRDGATGNLVEVYRVETAGGSAPKTCAGSPASFEVQYAAEYVFPPLLPPPSSPPTSVPI